jgi:antitoxin CptB
MAMRMTSHQPATQSQMRCGQISVGPMNREDRIKRLKFRSCHRGTKEADMMIGGFFEARHADWSDPEIDWFEAFLEEQDVDIMGWAIRTIPVPVRWQGKMMDDLMMLDFITIAK